MKCCSITIINLLFTLTSFCQDALELRCLERIAESTKVIQFPRFKGSIETKGHTVKFDNGAISAIEPSAEALTILNEGLIFPDLILSASTTGNATFNKPAVAFIGTLSISSFERFNLPAEKPSVKVFSFLLWRQNSANPMLYILQLTNEKAEMKTPNIEFVKGARLSAFGFCSIVI